MQACYGAGVRIEWAIKRCVATLINGAYCGVQVDETDPRRAATLHCDFAGTEWSVPRLRKGTGGTTTGNKFRVTGPSGNGGGAAAASAGG